MAVGNRLFRRDNDLQMLYAILEERIPLPSERVPGFPQGLEYILMKALARSREDRYVDAQALAQDLRAVARDNEDEWDSEASTLSRLVKDVLPEDLLASGRSGPGSDSRPSAVKAAQQPAAIPTGEKDSTGSWVEVEPTDDDEFAPRIVVIDPNNQPARPGPTIPAPVGQEEPSPGGMTAGTWAAILLLLAASAVFWIVIAPSI